MKEDMKIWSTSLEKMWKYGVVLEGGTAPQMLSSDGVPSGLTHCRQAGENPEPGTPSSSDSSGDTLLWARHWLTEAHSQLS